MKEETRGYPESYEVARGEKFGDRAIQREIVMAELGEDQRMLIEALFPSNYSTEYPLALQPRDDQVGDIVHVDQLVGICSPILFGKDGGYDLLFKLATTSNSPQELVNIFKGIRTLEQLEDVPYGTLLYHLKSQVRDSRRDFTQRQAGNLQNSQLNEKTRWLGVKVDTHFALKSDVSQTEKMDSIASHFFSEDSLSYAANRQYLGELYFYLILNNEYDIYWKDLFLYMTRKIDIREDGLAENGIFASDASFWSVVDGSWMGIDMRHIPTSKIDEKFNYVVGKDKELPGSEDEPYEIRLLKRRIATLEDRERLLIRQNESMRRDSVAKKKELDELTGICTRLRLEKVAVTQQLTDARLAIAKLHMELADAKNTATVRIQQNPPTGIFETFLTGNFTSRAELLRMPLAQRKKEIAKLRKAAGISLHGDNNGTKSVGGVDPLSVINAALDDIGKY